jgi:hypothetical protein
MSSWAKIVIYPLGLAGFALLLLYRFSQTASVPTWVLPVGTFIALLGGLFLAYSDRSKRSTKTGDPDRSADTPPSTAPLVKQVSRGDQSPNIANVQKDVRIEYGAAPNSKKK